MTRDEHLLTIAAEECAELAQRLSKALRFGMFETQPGHNHDNRERILGEYADLIAVMELIGFYIATPAAFADVDVPRASIEAKKLKIDKYLGYSATCGTVNK